MRPAFLALSELACAETWCWDLGCSTCGRMYFRYGLRELVRGKHPDAPDWFVYADRHHDLEDVLGDATFWIGSPEEQRELAAVVSEVPLEDLRRVGRFPDWLGHLGLVLWHTKETERTSRVLTQSLVPQLVEMLPASAGSAQELRALWEEGRRVLTWSDLGSVERDLMNADRG